MISSIYIGDKRVRIRAMDDTEDQVHARGLYYPAKRVIAIRASDPPWVQAETLLHEIIHAVWDARDMPSRPTEESVCRHLEEPLTNLFRDPEFVRAISAAAHNTLPIVEEKPS